MKASCDEEAHAFVIAVCRASSALKHGRSTRDGGDGFRRACVAWGVESFERAFKREPENLLRANPPESRTANGASFWSGTKRLPNALAFDATDARHATFVVAHAMLFSSLFSVTEVRSNDDDEDAEQFEPEGKDALNAARFSRRFARREIARRRQRRAARTTLRREEATTRVPAKERLKDADAEASSADRLAQATLDAFEDGRNVKAFRLSPSTPFDGPRRDPTRAAFVAAAAACRAVVFGVPVPRERELAAAATGSRPGTPGAGGVRRGARRRRDV
jgi:ubiquitin-activating enzyme E1